MTEMATAVVSTKTTRTKTTRRRSAPKRGVASKKSKFSKPENVSDSQGITRYLMPVHNVHCVPLPKQDNTH